MRSDCHQHLWPEALLDVLRARGTPPRMEGWTLYLAGEAPFTVAPSDVDALARAQRERVEGTERVLLSLSSPLGIEHLPTAEAAPLLDAWHDGGAEFGAPFEVWAAAGVAEPDPAALARVLARPGIIGLQLPATALSEPAALERVGPLLETLQRADLPLMVHPGPVVHPGPAVHPGPVLHPGPAPFPEAGHRLTPSWWPAVVPYVAQMHSAWYAWLVAGRCNFPRLRVAFVALAGLAPLHHERLAARGGAVGRIDPSVYYETSSYGVRAMDATLRVTGVDSLVHGSDRPNAEPTDPGFGDAFSHALFVTNPQRLLTGSSLPAASEESSLLRRPDLGVRRQPAVQGAAG